MITVTSAQITAWLALFLFPFVRILSMVASAPILGNNKVPARVKIGLSVLLTLIIAPTLDIQPGIDPASAQGIFILVQQILAGLAMGFILRLIFTAVEMAGDIIGVQMGLGFAIFFDPQNASYMPVVAQLLGIIAALLFLGMDGHLAMLAALANSFHTFPISSTVPAALAFHTVAGWGGSIFAYALQLSMPVIGLLLITNLALGILTRSAPQLNLFAVGFPVTLAVGLVALMLLMPNMAPLLERITSAGMESMQLVMQQLGK